MPLGPARFGRAVRRAVRWLYAANEAQYELWKRWCRRQRPWEDHWLHWVRDPDGWRLEGEDLPPRRRR